jgi:glycosyltransferase involved in cell wall biosynthesis
VKIGLVIPWFGRELKGGAEQLAWQFASRLSRRGHDLHVLTTCCRSHQSDWSVNYYTEGTFFEPERFSVHRFRVDRRDRKSFDRVCRLLQDYDVANLVPGVSPVGNDDAAIFVNQLIRSDQLLSFLRTNKKAYDWFVFLPYLYGPIIHGIGLVGERAVLQPCLHDESYAYLPQVAEAFYGAQRLLFNSEGEQELALKLFGPGIAAKSTLVGTGVEIGDLTSQNSENEPAERHRGRYLLYLGRKDVGKNVPLLLRAFQRFRRVRPNSDLHLVLAGNGSVDLNGYHSVTDLGLVTDAHKRELLQNCLALVQPSANESFSRVIMEAWLCGKPVAVQGSCLATSAAVERSNGGWLAETEEDWAALLTELDRASTEELVQLGRNGQHYAKEIADWDKVIARYEEALTLPPAPTSRQRPLVKRQAVHQVLPNLAFGDAISNQALFVRSFLREKGYNSNIYVHHIDPRVAGECELFKSGSIARDAALIYHHSVGTNLIPEVIAHVGAKSLVYHNITPAECFEPYRPEFAEVLRQGRRELRELAQHFPTSAGDSAYNAAELAAVGFSDPDVLPICVDPGKWNAAADSTVMARMHDGRTNILFVGRIAPNKKQDELVRAFRHYLALDPTARLILLGASEPNDPYVAHINNIIQGLGLNESVVLQGPVTEAELAAYYRSSHLFWSMSDHEGFCVPLVEAMWFDVPVIAFRSSAIPETLGDAALMFTRKDDLAKIAGFAHVFVEDRMLRGKVIVAQRKQRLKFTADAVTPLLSRFVGKLFEAGLDTFNRNGGIALDLQEAGMGRA